ncbi:peptidase M48 family protein [Sphingomonas changbaiensis NBRC 104936]|uniref:Peptidase M48 family protein n=1 Tax=Sphingomonas changbaiensis NBRC 104936 TaxID=1219043 RepID=A0A0E9MRJ4_9SPHN|nr:M48 family metallopeptidase [Sphingomonas changbaiensis]GAO40051.1 peptidase M48 family protein [Sphingomonas changbaiensis NBRC 104936]
MARAYLYDGATAIRHKVRIEPDEEGLLLSQEDGWSDAVPLGRLAVSDHSGSGLSLVRSDVEGWRLRVPAPVPAEIDRLFPRRQGYGRWIDRIGLWRAAGAFGLISAVVLASGYFAPTLLAPLVPPSIERAYGEALVGDFGGKYCSSPAGDAALRKLTAELDSDPRDLNVRVVDVPVVNAAALPAGNIVIFDKLFEEVDSPDQLAGILAHEIAHVRRRHVTAAMLREFGLGMFATALGGSTAGRVDGFVSLSFTRRAEAEADQGAIDMLRRARISPAPTAAFFRKLKAVEGDESRLAPALAYLSSHPLSSAREKKFERAALRNASYRSALTPREWTALRAICSDRAPTDD